MKKVLIVVPAGAVARDFFECGLIAELINEKNLSIEIWCHISFLEFLKSNYKYHNLKIDVLPYAPLGWFSENLLKLRHFFTRCKCVSGVKFVFRIEKYISHNNDLRKKLIASNPGLIVFPTPRYIDYEVELGLIAKKLGIKLLCVISSWDNMSKNPLLLRFDELFVWNTQMKNWAVKKHFYSMDMVSVVGALQFDPHFQRIQKSIADSNREDDKFFNIVYATLGLLSWNFKEDEFILYLHNIIRGLNTNKKIKLILRLHPHDQSRFKGKFENLDGVEIHSNKINFNPVKRSGDWYMKKDDISNIQDLLMKTDLMLNMGTTLHIESIIFNVPSFIVNFHQTNDEYVKTNLKKIAFDKHFSPLIKRGLINFISSENELIDILEKILIKENLYIPERYALIKEVAEYSDGQTAKRISNGIKKLIAE